MQISQLAKILSERVARAGKGERVTQIHLFGIEYADEIGSVTDAHIEDSEEEKSVE